MIVEYLVSNSGEKNMEKKGKFLFSFFIHINFPLIQYATFFKLSYQIEQKLILIIFLIIAYYSIILLNYTQLFFVHIIELIIGVQKCL